MPSYSKTIIFIFSIFLFSGCSQPQVTDIFNKNIIKKEFEYKSYAQEDRYIMFALEYDRQGLKEESRELYLKLYENTLKEEYFLEYIKLSFALKKHNDIIKLVEKNRSKIKKDEEKILRVYILALSGEKNFDKAKKISLELLDKSNNDLNNELLATILLQKEDFKEAKEVYERLYKKSSSSKSLVNLTNIMYVYLNEKKEAINLLESHTKLNGCNNLVCSRLLVYYQEEKNIDGVISVLKKTFYNLEDSSNHYTRDRVYKLLMYYLERKDINEAIKFLEKSNYDEDKLLSLYKNARKYEKAYSLANRLYEKKGNIDYLAQIAILEFEKAKDKRKVLSSVIKKFEDALTVLDNHIYQNYLGYLLIDYDIDIKKGMNFVNKALEKAPNNLAYIDSLAWGQYKLKDCTNAYKNMKKVVDSAGLEDEEIRTHWEKIKECK